jgi:hypothetical protein
MALDLANGLSFRKNDRVEIVRGDTIISGIVLNSGEGYMSPYEDMYYLMSAPHQGLDDLFAEENEIRGEHVLVSVEAREIPFSKLPEIVGLRRQENRQNSAQMNALAVICGRPGRDEYLVFLEVPASKK